jgi:predicted nucleic acid-binding protein
MPYLLDTNVISELRRPTPNPGVATWFESVVRSSDLYLSVLTVAELRHGVERLRPRNAAQAASLEAWLAELLGTYATRTISIDLEIADCWARTNAVRRVPSVDGLIAATALVRGWTLVTRNVEEVAQTGVALLNPFS